MGKKNKGKTSKKGQGLVKTETKTLKKDERKTKKMLADAGEEEIENLIAKFKQEDRKRVEVIETKCPPPSPRCNMTLTAHPDKDELIMFGGEFFNGSKTFVYNDLFFYSCKRNEWTHVSSPNQPPPRCAHQAVALRQAGGQLWLFGGEFASPSQLQFYHYKELWMLNLKDKQWQKINAPGGPSARSGHRMVAFRKQLIVFGGFHDNTRHYKYYNDVHAFNLDTYTWCQLVVSGTAPSPRSGCQLLASPDLNQLIVFGGYSKVSVKKDVDQGTVHMDMFSLAPQSKNKEEVSEKWKWGVVKQSGSRPSPRSGMASTLIHNNRAVLFGGVHDTERPDADDDDLVGSFFNTFYTLELDRGKWHETLLRGKREDAAAGKKRRKRLDTADEGTNDDAAVSDDDDDDVEETEENIKKLKLNSDVDVTTATSSAVSTETTTYDDGIFSVTVGPASVPTSSAASDVVHREDYFVPPPRMNTLLAVQHGLLYLYGGSVEVDDKELTRTDMYSLDLRKMDEWNVLRHDESGAQEWAESSSDSEEEMETDGAVAGAGGASGGMDEGDSDDDDDDDDDDDCDEADDNPPPEIDPAESMSDYYARTRVTYWLPLTKAELAGEGKTDVAERKVENISRKMAEAFFKA